MKTTPKGIEKVAKIIARRDGISMEDAIDEVTNCAEEMASAIENGAGIEDVYDMIMDDLGLESDYIEEMLDMF